MDFKVQRSQLNVIRTDLLEMLAFGVLFMCIEMVGLAFFAVWLLSQKNIELSFSIIFESGKDKGIDNGEN